MNTSTAKAGSTKKLARFLYTIGLARNPNVPDVPTVIELVPDQRGKDIIRLGASASDIGRAIIAPPGVPQERADALRAGVRAHGDGPGFHCRIGAPSA